MTFPTPLYRLIEASIEGTLSEFVAERRRIDGPPYRSPTSWRDIAAELSERAGFEVNHETLRLWFGTEAETAGGIR